MKRNVAFAVVLSALFPLTVAVLSALGETRFDVYFSLFTLEYFVASAVLSPKRRGRDYLGAALLSLFAYFVGMRVVEVLYAP